MELIIWLMAAYGMSQILVYGSIFDGFRESIHHWGKNERNPFKFLGSFLSSLISCMMCTSTWVGFLMSFIWSPFINILETNMVVGIFFDGMLASGGVWFINTVVEWFESSKDNG
tara:strand:- start:7863 stop:8204 length:342 start_codon:yes stop_codon:yes gene_type:complete